MSETISRRDLLRVLGTGVALIGSGAANAIAASDYTSNAGVSLNMSSAAATPIIRGVVADPALIPPPIKRNHPVHHEVTFESREMIAEIEPGAKFSYMTFNGQVPGPMIRVRKAIRLL